LYRQKILRGFGIKITLHKRFLEIKYREIICIFRCFRNYPTTIGTIVYRRMNGKPDKTEIYELLIEKMILRKMKEQNDEVGKSLEILNRLIAQQSSREPSSINPKRSINGKKNVMASIMDQKYNKYSSLESFYSNMKLEKSKIETELCDPAMYGNYTYGMNSTKDSNSNNEQ
jgi:hypothetical protein